MAPDMASSYDASSITILEGLSAVRKRPAMYIGSTDVRGLHHLVYEVVDNSIDEAMAGFCTRITVILHADNSVTVRDDGRGIPVDIHPKEGVPAVQVVMTKLHAGGKFDNNSYKVSGGLHGVGVSCVNALSEWLTVTVRRDGKRYRQHYSRGVPQDQLTVIGEADGHGTTVRFQPDEQIFEVLEFSYDTLKKRFEELAYLNKGLYIECIDERTSETHVFHAEGGIRQFVSDLNSGQQGIHPIIMAEGVVDNVAIDFALQYNAGYKETILTFANNIHTKEGGTHLVGFRTALTRAINGYVKNQPDLTKKFKGTALSGDDVREGLTAVISVKLPQPQFEGQTKTKLGNSEVAGMVAGMVYDRLTVYFEENPKDIRLIIDKAVDAARARELGMTVVISDHHLPPPELPPADAICNPRLGPEDDMPCPHLAGVGVAFFLMAAVNAALAPHTGRRFKMDKVLDLVALGTLADVMRLGGQNRILVRGGLDKLAEYGLSVNIPKMKADLKKYGIAYDQWFFESSLHQSGYVAETVALLGERGYTYEKDGALWLKTSDILAAQLRQEGKSDEAIEKLGLKDDVLRRANGFYTYFAADIAYHRNKFAVRGFDKVINIWGADHHGHVARLKGAMDALGLDGRHRLDIVLMQLVKLVRDGETVRMSKRTGKAISLTDLLDEIPVDACRWFFNAKPETQMEFDLGLAVREDSENPVYYVQYAYARICTLVKALAAEGYTVPSAAEADLSVLTADEEKALIKQLAQYPAVVQLAARDYDPSFINRYLVELAAAFHKFYNACRIKGEAENVLLARLKLADTARAVLKNGMTLIGCSAPEKM